MQGADQGMSSEIITVELGTQGNASMKAQNFETMNHPSGLNAYTMHWDDRKRLGIVQYMQGRHSFEIDNVMIVTGIGNSGRPQQGVTNWDILFSVNSAPTASYEEARTRTMALLGKLRDAGWKRYIFTAEPRLSGRAAMLYALSDSSSVYSMDSIYTPTMEEWKKIVAVEPQWYFYANEAFVNVTISYQPTAAGRGYYLMDLKIQAASDFYLPYFSDSPEKMKTWENYLPGVLKPGKKERLVKEARLKAQGYAIDVTYEDPPIELSEYLPDSPH
jgi:hypothetical protein